MGTNTPDEKLDKLWTDFYFGSGKDDPAMTVRVDRMERFIDAIRDDAKSTRSMQLTTMLTVIGGVVVAFVSFKMGWLHP